MHPKITHLERVEINNLWGEVDIDWQLHPKVNILIGVNGSGKTTLLDIIESISNNDSKPDNYDYDKVKLSFNDNSFVISERCQTPVDNLGKYHVTTVGDVAAFDIDKISTFDIPQVRTEPANQKSAEIASGLDILLEQLLDDFKGYQLKNVKVAEIEHNQLLFELNSLFDCTRKVVEFDNNNGLSFRKNGKTISPYRLSTGEKQILIILLKVILHEEKPGVLLIDDPELSLHLAWQLKFIDMIQWLNENCQLIIATHAPGIFNKGWRDKLTKMEHIVIDRSLR
jgi:predicted ATP-dependent endonuclease of OLD family